MVFRPFKIFLLLYIILYFYELIYINCRHIDKNISVKFQNYTFFTATITKNIKHILYKVSLYRICFNSILISSLLF